MTASTGGPQVDTFTFPVEPGRVFTFARSVGDVDPIFSEQLNAQPGVRLVTPPTFVRAAELFDPAAALLIREVDGMVSRSGGSTDTLHAEQEFEFFEPFLAGESIRVETRRGREWVKEGRTGTLRFFETITEYVNTSGRIAVRARKVSAQRLAGAAGE